MWEGLLLGGGLVDLLLHLLRLLHEVVVGLLDLGRELLVGGLEVGGDLLRKLLALLRDEGGLVL